ncbi:MAG: 30S ribosomal protein S20 [Firmicutes bacterium]|nr:30S ribosomal protein S20 [Bacillota bacterium]
MPVNRSAIKKARTSKERQMRNAAVKSQVKTAVKKYEASLGEEDLARCARLLRDAESALDKAAKKGVIHKSQANRRKSRLAERLNVMSEKAESNEEGLA